MSTLAGIWFRPAWQGLEDTEYVVVSLRFGASGKIAAPNWKRGINTGDIVIFESIGITGSRVPVDIYLRSSDGQWDFVGTETREDLCYKFALGDDDFCDGQLARIITIGEKEALDAGVPVEDVFT